ncbi:rfaE bifunctional protein kinase chain/domain [Neolewinella xylanilytica]|uniref:RfaE bifunctional protein kinase chain/domain n=1 Tax=Neolewinella xylanilytica TaxID=1514080 RepID=A0A2S6I5I2_9BACT|nr:bifunctional ADP-heptose synthase [Neolewinella xylanilytica]PPK86341.1 rfaE bifunctional protein kinase chain/domain [Neolewinella xylanilytica]
MLLDFSTLRALVVGDLMLDRYLSGSVERISPEAPVPVLRYRRQEDRLGGAGNVALNLVALGAGATTAGVMGADENAGLLGRALREHGIGDAPLVTDASRPTTVKTRVIAQDQQLLRIDRESTEDLAPTVEEGLLGAIREHIRSGQVDLIILQDYNKGVLTAEVIRQVTSWAATAKIPVAVDPKVRNFWSYNGVDLFKPNLREIQQQCDFAVTPDVQSLDRAAALIFARLACKRVMITLSEYGIYTHDGTHSAIHPTRARRIADVSGAGDTVIGVAACGLAAGMDLTRIARLANLAGAQVIAKPGVVAVDLEALRQDWAAEA